MIGDRISWLGACALMTGCTAIFGIEKLEPFPEGGGGTGQDGGGGTIADGGGGSGGDGGNCADADGDMVTDCAGDCDDGDPLSYPGAIEICGDDADNDCNGEADPETPCMGLGTYVSVLVGMDTNPGTQAAPLATIAAGMANATLIGNGQGVFVGEGVYPEKIALVEGISLYGGHQCDVDGCTWLRDPTVTLSTIANNDTDGIVAGNSITRLTVLDGFTVAGFGTMVPNDVIASAIRLNGGTPTIRGNAILGAPQLTCGTVCRNAAIYASGASNAPAGALIASNIVIGGSSSALAYAIRADGASIEMASNDLSVGTAPTARPLTFVGDNIAIILRDNVIHSGTCLNAGAPLLPSNDAVYVTGVGASAVIEQNRINVDPARVGSCNFCGQDAPCAGIRIAGAAVTIANNVIFGPQSNYSAGVLINDATAPLGPAVVSANTIHGGGTMMQPVSAALAIESENNMDLIVGRFRGNILHAGLSQARYGLYELDSDQGTAKPEALTNNAFTNFTVAYLAYNGSSTNIATVAQMEAALAGVASANLDAACPLDATFHLEAGSPCIDTSAPSDAPPTDFEGDPRPLGAGFDIGADERQ